MFQKRSKVIIRIAVVIAVISTVSCKKGVSIIVENKSEATIENIIVKSGGSTVTITSLKPGASWKKLYNNRGENSAAVIYRTPEGKTIKKEAGYFEKNYKGYIKFTYEQKNKKPVITVEDRVELPGLF